MKKLIATLIAVLALAGSTAMVAQAGPSDGADLQGWTWDDE